MWPDEPIVLSVFGHLQQWKFAQKYTIVPKWVKNFAQNEINLKYIAKDVKILAKVVVCRKIWSHWTQRSSFLHVLIQCFLFHFQVAQKRIKSFRLINWEASTTIQTNLPT